MEPDKKKLSWLNDYWRPMAAVVYLVICTFDFLIFPWIFGMQAPSVSAIALAVKDLDPQVGSVLAAPRPQWQPLTLMGGGTFHLAFGAIVGITAWSRGQAHIEGMRNGSFEPYPEPNYTPYHVHSPKPPCNTTPDSATTVKKSDQVDNPDA